MRAGKEKKKAKEEAQVAPLAAVGVGDAKARAEVTWLGSKTPWQLRRMPSAR